MPLTLLAIPAFAAPVSLTAADGTKLSAESAGAGVVGILLVHDEGRSRADWSAVAPRLAQLGQVLTLDLRGHGASSGAPLPEDWTVLQQDVAAGVKWLGSHGCTDIHVVGARLGAALALGAAATAPEVDDVVLLSPPLTQRGVKISAAAPAYGARPMLIVTGREDALGAKAASWLDANAQGHHRLVAYPNAGQGAALFNTAAEVETVVLGWLSGEFDPGRANAAALAERLKTGESQHVETTGTRLEDRDR